MISDSRHSANISNAQHSTGPRTPSGKAAVAQNAVTHGLTARNIVPRTDDEKIEFPAIRVEALEEYQPAGHTETLLVDRIVHARCSLSRVTRLLSELETGTLDDVLDPEYDKPIARLNRYYTMHERSLYRALRTLKTEQTNRGLKEASLGLTDAVGLPPLADFSKIAKVLKTAPPPKERPKTAQEIFQNAAAKADAIVAREIAQHGPIPPALRGLITNIIRQSQEAAKAAEAAKQTPNAEPPSPSQDAPAPEQNQ